MVSPVNRLFPKRQPKRHYNANEILPLLRAMRPDLRWAGYVDGAAIAAYNDQRGQWVAIMAMTCDFTWHVLTGEMLFMGEPLFEQEGWIEGPGRPSWERDDD